MIGDETPTIRKYIRGMACVDDYGVTINPAHLKLEVGGEHKGGVTSGKQQARQVAQALGIINMEPASGLQTA